MEKVLNQAEQLAETILESEEFIKMRLSEQAAMKDEEATRLVADYAEKRQAVEELLTSNNMDHEALGKASEALSAVEKQIDEHPLLKQMQQARGDFNEMMKQVNKLIRFVITGEADEESEGGCTGSCETCGGACHHH